MPKKRLIFTLLYQDNAFYLSRNFRLQRVGDLDWLRNNYKFTEIAKSIDELVIIDVSRSSQDKSRFCEVVVEVSGMCFMPLALGGGINSLEDAAVLINNGAEKLIINSAIDTDPDLVKELVSIYGSQSIIGSIDYKIENGVTVPFINQGSERVKSHFNDYVQHIYDLKVGEIYLNSIDRDGSGQGYIFDTLKDLGELAKIPIIVAGGAGNQYHLKEALEMPEVDGAATANLFNFMGNGLPNARRFLLEQGIPLAKW